LVQIRPQSF